MHRSLTVCTPIIEDDLKDQQAKLVRLGWLPPIVIDGRITFNYSVAAYLITTACCNVKPKRIGESKRYYSALPALECETCVEPVGSYSPHITVKRESEHAPWETVNLGWLAELIEERTGPLESSLALSSLEEFFLCLTETVFNVHGWGEALSEEELASSLRAVSKNQVLLP